MTRSIRWMLLIRWSCTAALLAVFALLLAVAKAQTPTPPVDSLAAVGGLRYQAVEGRPINPSNPVDAHIVKGLPAGELHLGSNQILYGVFISVANDSPRPLPSAARIDLRDDALHVYRPLRVPAGNPYAYRPDTLAPGTTIPPTGTVAADNLAANGLLLLYRVPAWQYRNGMFELVVHDPLHAGSVQTVLV
jgi:hypothetical protein